VTKSQSSSIHSLARNASLVAGATLISRILGLGRDLIIAFSLGAGPFADAFFVAFRLPNLLRRLFAEGSLTMAFVPVFTRTKNEQGLGQAFLLARSVQVWLLIILGIIVCLSIFLANPITSIIAPGFKKNPEVFALTVGLVRICFPYIIFISSVALCMGILNSMNHFLAPSLAPSILNIVLISFALLAYFLHLSSDSVPLFLSIGVLVAGLGQWLLQQPFLRTIGFKWKGPFDLRNKGVKKIGHLMLPTIVGAAVYQLNIVFSTILASFLPLGSISYLYYADRLVQFPLGVFGVAVSTAALPSLSELATKQNMDAFKNTLNSSLSLTLFISLPATAGLIGLSYPLVKTLFGHGAFSSHAVQATANALIGYCIGLPAFSCVRSIISAFYSLEDTKTPVKIAFICMLINITLGYFLMQKLVHVGLALAVSISSWVNVLLLGFYLRKKIGPWFTGAGEILKMILLSFALLAGVTALASFQWIALLSIPLWALGYFYSSLLLKISPGQILWRALIRNP
jgi:putative peptidoglycan lipid II flippase